MTFNKLRSYSGLVTTGGFTLFPGGGLKGPPDGIGGGGGPGPFPGIGGGGGGGGGGMIIE